MYVIRYKKFLRKKDRLENYRYLSGFSFNEDGFEFNSTLDESEAIKLRYVSARVVYELLIENFRCDYTVKSYILEITFVDNS